MNARDYWNIFMETGAPEAYLSYTRLMQMEEKHVPDDQRTGPAGNGLQ